MKQVERSKNIGVDFDDVIINTFKAVLNITIISCDENL